MKDIISFVLIAFGTLGIILDRYIITMGGEAFFAFALANVIGLVLCYFVIQLKKEVQEKNEI